MSRHGSDSLPSNVSYLGASRASLEMLMRCQNSSMGTHGNLQRLGMWWVRPESCLEGPQVASRACMAWHSMSPGVPTVIMREGGVKQEERGVGADGAIGIGGPVISQVTHLARLPRKGGEIARGILVHAAQRSREGGCVGVSER